MKHVYIVEYGYRGYTEEVIVFSSKDKAMEYINRQIDLADPDDRNNVKSEYSYTKHEVY